jgi:hypothetical protein
MHRGLRSGDRDKVIKFIGLAEALGRSKMVKQAIAME